MRKRVHNKDSEMKIEIVRAGEMSHEQRKELINTFATLLLHVWEKQQSDKNILKHGWIPFEIIE